MSAWHMFFLTLMWHSQHFELWTGFQMKMMVCFVIRQPQPVASPAWLSCLWLCFYKVERSFHLHSTRHTGSPLCAVWSQPSIPKHPLPPPLNPSKQPFPLLTCYKASEDFCLLVEDVHCHVSGGLEVQWVALEQDHETKGVRRGWLPVLGLIPFFCLRFFFFPQANFTIAFKFIWLKNQDSGSNCKKL